MKMTKTIREFIEEQVVERLETATAERKQELKERADLARDNWKNMLDNAKLAFETQLLEMAKPDAVAIEELFFGQNVTTGIGVAQARGVVLLAIQQAGLKVTSYKPMQVKQALVGYGNASKHQMMDMTKRLLHLNEMPKPDDAADAIAIALCHARSSTSLLAKVTQER